MPRASRRVQAARTQQPHAKPIELAAELEHVGEPRRPAPRPAGARRQPEDFARLGDALDRERLLEGEVRELELEWLALEEREERQRVHRHARHHFVHRVPKVRWQVGTRAQQRRASLRLVAQGEDGRELLLARLVA